MEISIKKFMELSEERRNDYYKSKVNDFNGYLYEVFEIMGNSEDDNKYLPKYYSILKFSKTLFIPSEFFDELFKRQRIEKINSLNDFYLKFEYFFIEYDNLIADIQTQIENIQDGKESKFENTDDFNLIAGIIQMVIDKTTEILCFFINRLNGNYDEDEEMLNEEVTNFEKHCLLFESIYELRMTSFEEHKNNIYEYYNKLGGLYFKQKSFYCNFFSFVWNCYLVLIKNKKLNRLNEFIMLLTDIAEHTEYALIFREI